MNRPPMELSEDQTLFSTAFRGSFRGVLRWEQLDDLWEAVRTDADGGWYVYAVGEPPPESPVPRDQILKFIEGIDTLLRKEHPEDYCGIVYADDFARPSFIKIFDPNNLGVSCGYSDDPPLPGWILSKLKPADLKGIRHPAARRRWWQRLFGT
jgi:hypothetical protein